MSSNFRSILKCCVSAGVGATLGLVEAEVIANSLVEVTNTRAFSIIFGIAFLGLGGALAWRCWRAQAERVKVALMGSFALLVVISGIACFFVTKDWLVTLSAAEKTPLYSLLGISLSFALTFCITELVNAQVCDSCCGGDEESEPIIKSKKQLAVIFGGSLLMGAVYGIMFGSMDVEKDGPAHHRFKELLLWSIPVGVIIGGCIGFANQWLRDRFDKASEYRRWETIDDPPADRL